MLRLMSIDCLHFTYSPDRPLPDAGEKALSFRFWSHVELKGHLNQHQLEIERVRQMWSFHSWNTAYAFCVWVYIAVHVRVCAVHIELKTCYMCVFFFISTALRTAAISDHL